ncbi:elongator complex protein 1 [Acrasis kona]|uniref:Elongator complex protein 1 n=1 Tax=Acrasis kona TaxID=1008807 RepID=A0AAW2YY44_9EUKA
MRNLVLLQHLEANCANENDDVMCYCPIEGSLYFAVRKSCSIFSMDLKTGEVSKDVDIKESVQAGATPISATYIAELESLCIATDAGDILTFNIHTSICESVAVVSEGLKSMSWSPDQELVVFATANDTLMTLSKEFEQIAEVDIQQEPTTTNRSTVTLEQTSTTVLSEESKSSPPQISWRADGMFFAVNSYDPRINRRHVRVWDRSDLDAVHSKSEHIEGLDASCSYRPDGSIIASHQYLQKLNETRICFTERNGLQHYDFTLDKSKTLVSHLLWNSGNDVLCVVSSDSNNQHILRLYYRGNYHWYLKQHFILESPATCVQWDAELPLRLHVHCQGGSYSCYDFCWDHCMSVGNESDNPTIMAVIDGCNLLMTPMRHCLVPPPMSASKLEFPHPVRSASFGPNHQLAVQLSNKEGTVLIYQYDPTQSKPPKFGLPPSQVATFNISQTRLLTVLSDDTIACVEPSKPLGQDTLKFYKHNGHVNEISYPDHILRITHDVESCTLFVQTNDGSVFQQPYHNNEISPPEERSELSFQQPCEWMQACKVQSEDAHDQEDALVGLNYRGLLYVQGNVAASNCSSFTLHGSQHLLFTTFNHQLRILSLHQSASDLLESASSNASSRYDQGFRELERGAKLVCAIPRDVRVVLQMPRGNLEGIYPKALLLDHLRDLLNQHLYGTALSLMRKHVVDANLLHDHDPQHFFAHVNQLISQCVNADHINLFLSTLTPSDVTLVKYIGYHHQRNHVQNHHQSTSKVNQVCIAVRNAIRQSDRKQELITSTITTFVKCDPPQLDDALRLIRDMKESELNQQIKSSSSSEAALRYLIVLCGDVDKLYNVALGMYDFELVLMVAQKSQKDPKEYLPYLAQLQQIRNVDYQRYTIDMDLGRWSNALVNLSKSAPTDADHHHRCIQLVKNHELYELGMQLFDRDVQFLEAFGDYLYQKESYQQSAITFLSGNHHKKAMDAYVMDGDYRMAMSIATHRLRYSRDACKQIAFDLIRSCEKLHRVKDVALILCEYLNDHEEAVLTLTKSHVWNESMRIASKFDRNDLIQTHIEPAVVDGLEETCNDLDDSISKLTKYCNRLGEARLELERSKRLEMEALDEGVLGVDVDQLSDSGSIQSDMSAYSGVSVLSSISNVSARSGTGMVTARNKKKRTKLKKGGPFEEDNLVNRIYSLIPQKAQISSMSELMGIGVYFGLNNESKQVQEKLKSLLQLVRDRRELIESEYYVPSVDDKNVPDRHVVPRRLSDLVGTFLESDEKWMIKILL